MKTRCLLVQVALAICLTSFVSKSHQPLVWAQSSDSFQQGEQTDQQGDDASDARSKSIYYKSPAGDLPATREINIGGLRAAVLNNGRLLTPAGTEVNVDAPKPYGLALSPDGKTLATINSGASRFSVTLVRNLDAPAPESNRINVNATFMGVVFSSDGARFYASGGENGNIWVGDTATNTIIGSVNLNTPTYPLNRPLVVTTNPSQRFRGTFPGNMALTNDSRYLYVVDQASFHVHVIDTTKIAVGVDDQRRIVEPDNFAAVVGRAKVGRYPYGIALSPDNTKLFVTNVGVFEFKHLRPENPTGDRNRDYPLCFPAAGYPNETEGDTQLKIKKVDPRNLPDSQRDPEGIRCGYINEDLVYTVPGLGSPNVKESSSVYILDVAQRTAPVVRKVVKTGPRVGEVEDEIETYGGSHPNSVVASRRAIYVANGNNDSISVLNPRTYEEVGRISLAVFRGYDRRLKGIQPVALALSPDQNYLYVAEAGINAVAVIELNNLRPRVLGHIPVGWWPSSLAVSSDGATLYVANSKGRGAGPNNNFPPDNLGSPSRSTLGTVSIIRVPSESELAIYTSRVRFNNGFTPNRLTAKDCINPLPCRPGVPSEQIKHVIFLNKENATHDLLLGDITATRKGVPVNGEPSYSLGYDASPNHHELALGFAFSDNFFLEPSVSSDGHRWLTGSYTTEMEETHWPASYGGQRVDAGDNPNVFLPYPGRLGFTDANGSPDPNDYNQHGGIYLHLARHGKNFVNFGNGFEFAQVDEDFGTEPTGIRNHVNVPMEKIVRDNTDHMFPEYNTKIPDAPLPEDSTRFNRFGRFKQVFESEYVDRQTGQCKLPAYVDLFYPNDHGGGANDINPNGPPWSFRRFVQDNDAALGLTVELISNSPCWKNTVIFVVEDDTQNGLDHVDGHRSIFLAISPWVKRQYVSKTHTSLASIFKTVNLLLGIPPLNQYDVAATDLRDMFTSKPDYTPYRFKTVEYAKGASKAWIEMTKDINFGTLDADELRLRAAILKSEGLPRKKADTSRKK